MALQVVDLVISIRKVILTLAGECYASIIWDVVDSRARTAISELVNSVIVRLLPDCHQEGRREALGSAFRRNPVYR